MVHVDDVARAHIFLLEHPNPKGRYNCSPFIATIEEIVDLVSSKYPELQMPTFKWVVHINSLSFSMLITWVNLWDFSFIFTNIIQLFSSSRELMEVKGPKFPQLTSKKLMDAGFKFKYSLEEMFEDAIDCCKEKGYLWTMKLIRLFEEAYWYW